MITGKSQVLDFYETKKKR